MQTAGTGGVDIEKADVVLFAVKGIVTEGVAITGAEAETGG